MEQKEFTNILVSIILFSAIVSLEKIIFGSFQDIPKLILFSTSIILIGVFAKKIVARSLDIDVEHEIWTWKRYGLKNTEVFKNPLSAGIIIPLLVSALSLGIAKVPLFLTFETKALKSKGFKKKLGYKYSGITDKENSVIASAGIGSILFLGIISYLLPTTIFEEFFKLATYYAFFNMFPISRLDGTQIYFGSKKTWTILAALSTLFLAVTLLI